MPRIRRSPAGRENGRAPKLLPELVAELKNARDSGQPIIDEFTFPATNRIRVAVIWDKWEGVPDEERVATIYRAFQQTEGKEYTDRIGIALGVTVPEAVRFGLLPYQVVPVARPTDRVSIDDCKKAMRDEGATIMPSGKLELRFTTHELAEAAIERLISCLPGSEHVWLVVTDPTDDDR